MAAQTRVRVGFDGSDRYYPGLVKDWVLPGDSVVIHRHPGTGGDVEGVLANPAVEWNNPEAFWTAGKTFTDAANNVSIRIDSLDNDKAVITIGPAGG